MRRFEDYHPLALFLYFLAVGLLVTLFMHPCIVVLSLLGAISLWLVRNGGAGARSHLFYLAFFVIMVLVNLLFRHGGATVLLVLNHNPVTLESLLYGVFAGAMLISVMYWCRSLSQVMSADKLLYLFGKLSPRLALIVSMAMRYIPLFTRQAGRVQAVQRAMGEGQRDNLIDNTRASLKTVSVMTTWALENGIVTADSMAARGYGVGRRSVYHLFRWHPGDVVLLLAVLLLGMAVAILGGMGALRMVWYPYLAAISTAPAAVVAYVAYGMLAFLPTALEIGERARWKYLHSKI